MEVEETPTIEWSSTIPYLLWIGQRRQEDEKNSFVELFRGLRLNVWCGEDGERELSRTLLKIREEPVMITACT
jgi:hypothetical protein